MSPRRRELLNELRAEQCREWSRRTPAERLERADEMREFAQSIGATGSRSDEPVELLKELSALRRARAKM